jgi:hypothetical protein
MPAGLGRSALLGGGLSKGAIAHDYGAHRTARVYGPAQNGGLADILNSPSCWGQVGWGLVAAWMLSTSVLEICDTRWRGSGERVWRVWQRGSVILILLLCWRHPAPQ